MRRAAQPDTSRFCSTGLLLFLFFLGTFVFYLYVRTTRTLDLGRLFLWYGVITLVVECFGAVTVALYAINLLWDPVYDEFGEDIRKPGMPLVRVQTQLPSTMGNLAALWLLL